MDGLLVLKLLHILCFVYWLGGDLGTFYASRFVCKPDLSVETRNTALTIMMGCDQAPRFCMPIIFPLGFELAKNSGYIDISPAWVGMVWLTSFVWLGTVIVLHFAHNKSFIPFLTKFDHWLRVAVIIALGAFGVYTLQTDHIISQDWVSFKILVFAALVACGLFIRIKLRPFIAAWGQLMTTGATDEVNNAISGSIAQARPFVYVIWLGLIVNAAYGIHLIGY